MRASIQFNTALKSLTIHDKAKHLFIASKKCIGQLPSMTKRQTPSYIRFRRNYNVGLRLDIAKWEKLNV